MEAMYVLIGISLVVALAFLAGFFWAVRSKQYDDDFTPSVRMLFDDEIINQPDTNQPDKDSN